MMLTSARRKNSPRSPLRIGAAIGPHDPYWVQLRECAYKRIEQLGASLIPLEISDSNDTLFSLDPASLAEEVLAQDLDVVVCQTLPLGTIYQLVYNDMPVVFLGESQLQHRLFCSPRGLYQAGQMAAEHIARKIGGKGRVLCVGGLLDLGEDKGVSRISGLCDTLSKFPQISVLNCPTAWLYEQAYPLVYSALREMGSEVDAIFGISDSIALAARDAGRALGVLSPDTVIVGINGDPLALAAVVDGSFSATVETCAEALGWKAAELAVQAAKGEPLPRHYSYKMTLITSDNVMESAARKLISIANLPNRLVGVNREEEQQRVTQLETGAAINRNVGSQLDRRRLVSDIASLICENYGFDHVQFFTWSQQNETLLLEGQEGCAAPESIPLEDAGLLGEAIRCNETIFIPDIRFSNRFQPDRNWPDTRSRVVLPVRLGDDMLGLLDLHCRRPVLNLRWEIIGLQSLADQFAIALRNAELYSAAVEASENAERANKLKTRLLANVSHELRTPLNVILGYSQAALSTPNLYGIALPESLRRDLRYIYQSGEHLIRIINDLLDLSRAEIGELNVFPEPVDTRVFFQEIFDSMAKTRGSEAPQVVWKMQVPGRLPLIQADPVRLRQVLLNLLSNACKFTTAGQIVLGAEVEPPYLHFWVSDSGTGIPIDQQERIFEPFVSSHSSSRRQEGIGLGLSITRRLIALHGGSMSLESQPGQGSSFHVYWPLPNLAGELSLPPALGERPALLLFASPSPDVPRVIPEEVRSIAARKKLEIRTLFNIESLEAALRDVQPVLVAWDMYEAAAEDWNLIQYLRRHPQLSCLPLLLFHGTAQQCGSAGITNVLLKPFQGKKLADLIDSLQPQVRGRAVLIVDDDPQALALYARLVEEVLPGAAILRAEDGAQAITMLDDQVPALVILDLMMPKVDGFKVLEHIRSDARTCMVPVVVLSGKLLSIEDSARLNFANVVFHTKGLLHVDEAVAALRQTLSGEMRLGQPTSLLVKQALAHLHQNYARQLSRGAVAEAVGVSENYLTQIFRQELGMPPMECLNRLRIQKASELLRASDDSITTIALKVGITDPAYFSRVFRKINGCSPHTYRRG